MEKTNTKRQRIREFILNNVEAHPRDISRITAEAFNISRQSVVNHINALITKGLIHATGRTRAREYSLAFSVKEAWEGLVTRDLEEDVVWRETMLPFLKDVKENVLAICSFGFTEMLNNVIDHSDSEKVLLTLKRSAVSIILRVEDQGIGIFQKLQSEFGLNDPRQALLELSKGKLTTAPEDHSGEGIFFTSRMFDSFMLISGTLVFTSTREKDDWFFDSKAADPVNGTLIEMKIHPKAPQTIQAIFDRFTADDEDHGFTRTRIPITLAQYEGEALVSRSQAKRILARVERFKEVILDFEGVTQIGQGFADEMFRVFAKKHPDVVLMPMGVTPEVEKMIKHVTSNRA